MLTGRIHSFESFGAADGPGIRAVVFFQGCPMRCLFCHNPDTWNPAAGTEVTADELVAKILPYRAFYRGGGGVTLSGGEPLAQPEFCLELLQGLRESGIHTAVDTSGSVPLDRCRAAVDAADMLLLDIKSANTALCEKITGCAQCLEREREMLDYCEKTGKRVWIRHVAVPGLTLEEGPLRELAAFLEPYSCVERVELLPFHKLGEHKWAKDLYTLADTRTPTAEEMSRAADIIGEKAKCGGQPQK